MLSDVTTPQDLDDNLRFRLAELTGPTQPIGDPSRPVRDGTSLTGELAQQVFEAQLISRHLDLAARWLHSFNAGFFTVGSSGHEGNAAVAIALRPDDPALLHYRSGGFYCARAAQVSGSDPIHDVLRGLAASAGDPVSGGRYKLFANPALRAIPTAATPTASHLPKAVGMGYALGLGRPVEPAGGAADWPPDALVVCSFGDAAANRASATTAFNAAGWLDRAGQRLPVLFVCEDNGASGSATSPDGWVADTLRFRPGLHYFAADGCDVAATYDAASRAVAWVRKHRRPAVLHLDVVSLMSPASAGADAVRPAGELAAVVARDPLVATARLLVEAGIATPEELIARYDDVGWRVRRAAEEVLGEPKLASVNEIISTLAPRHPARVAREVITVGGRLGADDAVRAKAFGGSLPEAAGPLTLAQTISAALVDGALGYPQMIIMGEDVVDPSDGTSATAGLRERLGPQRVVDTVPDETALLGLSLGCGLAGMLPVAQVESLAYLRHAEGQLRDEAATTQFFSRGGYRNPMVLRVPGLAHQPGFEGHFRNDNAIGMLRDIPGLVVAVPARAEDAAPLLRTCLAAAVTDGSVCVFCEPVALYDTTDLYAADDGQWRSEYVAPGDWGGAHVPIGHARVYLEGSGADLTIITFGNGVRMSLRIARALAAEDVGTRVVDLRWLSPLPVADIVRESSETGRVLVVDETRRSGGVGEGVLAVLVDAGYVGAARRVAAVDSFVPLGPAAEQVMISEEQIMRGARSLLAH